MPWNAAVIDRQALATPPRYPDSPGRQGYDTPPRLARARAAANRGSAPVLTAPGTVPADANFVTPPRAAAPMGFDTPWSAPREVMSPDYPQVTPPPRTAPMGLAQGPPPPHHHQQHQQPAFNGMASSPLAAYANNANVHTPMRNPGNAPPMSSAPTTPINNPYAAHANGTPLRSTPARSTPVGTPIHAAVAITPGKRKWK